MKNMRHIEVVPYNPQWPSMFELESSIIKAALGDQLIAVYHVGSTAVPGLAAKPKIDMIIVVKDPQQTIGKFESIGFQYRGEYNIPLHYGFSKRGDVGVNLHVYEEGHPEIELNLLFRDYLRNNPSVRDEYAALKIGLLQDETSHQKENGAFTGYTLRKGDFIRDVLKKAGFDRIRMLKCNDQTEWNAAKRLRLEYLSDRGILNDPNTRTFNHKEHEHLVLYRGTEIVGYAHVQLWPGHRAMLRMMQIEEEERGHGYGGLFLELIEKWLKIRGYRSIHVESCSKAFPFYQRHRYTPMPLDDPEDNPSAPGEMPMGKHL
ncbi:MAG: GNAT family N-acetyltransferase [Verrucomicrobia bacterium]|nr:GNAT family N-acetyltransferase [Verrucomicrobiota bacterium]